MIRVITESGAVYEIDREAARLRRVSETHAKRGDGEWLTLLNADAFAAQPAIGSPMFFALEPLERFGSDDYGNRGGMTVRHTTPVVSIEDAA